MTSRILIPFLLLLCGPAFGQPADGLLTRAEATGFAETTRYDEVIDFITAAAAMNDRMHVGTFGYSVEGRALPLVVYGDVASPDPEAVQAAPERLRVFFMANIHAGEVAGKEAALALIRELALERHTHWADSMVILIAPIYNADGNERINLYNRRLQHGPIGGMGTRQNAQDLDLNRDKMKLDSPEARSLAGFLTAYDPHVLVDLHTTNGTRHAYHLTYSPPLHPSTPAGIDRLLREELFPSADAGVLEKRGWHMFYYGNLPWPSQVGWPPGWYTFDHRPRFTTNYAGVRNRIGILSEAYSYATFEDRIEATRLFVHEILAFAHQHAGRMVNITRAADQTPVAGREIVLRAELKRSEKKVPVLMGDVIEEAHPATGEIMFRRTDSVRTEFLYKYGSFEATLTTTAPSAYVVMPDASEIADRLRAHGISVENSPGGQLVAVERFRVDGVEVAERPFQGRHEHVFRGEWVADRVTIPAGALIVSVDQPLGLLAVLLLEPASDDGLPAWGFLGATESVPILRLP
jgi:hypothetical protein